MRGSKLAYQSKFIPQNKSKYIGNNINNIVLRSTWETGLAKWCDSNRKVLKYAIESVIVPYMDTVSMKMRKYYVDFYIETVQGEKYFIEIKPQHETVAPTNYTNQKTELQKMLIENVNGMDLYYNETFQKKFRKILTYSKNQDKWKAANSYAVKYGAVFQVWTEYTLKQLGIKIVDTFKKNINKKKKSTRVPIEQSKKNVVKVDRRKI